MKNKKFLFWTSVVTLIPTVVGLILWNQLPDRMPTHWGVSGQVNGWSSKAFAVFGLPLMLLAFHGICALAMKLDKQNQTGGNKKLMDMVLWIFPVLSVMSAAFVYGSALGEEIRMTSIMAAPMGLLFVLIGNYLPKCRQNSTLGIKLKWTFNNDENWNKTHRLGGLTWVVCGLGIIVCGLLDWLVVIPVLFAVMVLVPTIYSWRLYRKQLAAGTANPENPAIDFNPKVKWISWVLAVATCVLVSVLMFTGSVETVVEGDSLVITASYWDDLTLDMEAIESVEYRPEGVDGSREWGYGSAKLALGAFYNEELGNYTRYTNAQTGACILIRAEGKWLVLNADGEEATKALYESILSHIS